MNVSLVSITQPFISDLKNPEDIIAYCARVSNPTNQLNTETAPKLLKFLVKHKHWSPFEMVDMTLEIKTSRAIAAQILRHRSFSFQEFSQRYANPVDSLNRVVREARLQDHKNRQNSIEVENESLQQSWAGQQDLVWLQAVKAYNWAIQMGIAKEQARAVLPEGLTESRLYVNGTLRSWLHYIDLREKNGTQKEHMEIARACADAITKIFPMGSSYLAPPK